MSLASGYAKTTEPIEILYEGGLTHVGPRNHVLHGVEILTGRCHMTGTAMRALRMGLACMA